MVQKRRRDWEKTVAAGSVAGMASTMACHPFDTIRTRLQTTSTARFRGAIDCLSDLVKKEGPLALYRGLAAPLVAQGVYKSIIFTTNDIAGRRLRQRRQGRPLGSGGIFYCGAVSGFVNAFVVTPVELVRTQLMTQYGTR